MSVTAQTAAAATAASAALPPSRKAARPAAVASGWPLATRPFAARTDAVVTRLGYPARDLSRREGSDRGDDHARRERTARARRRGGKRDGEREDENQRIARREERRIQHVADRD